MNGLVGGVLLSSFVVLRGHSVFERVAGAAGGRSDRNRCLGSSGSARREVLRVRRRLHGIVVPDRNLSRNKAARVRFACDEGGLRRIF